MPVSDTYASTYSSVYGDDGVPAVTQATVGGGPVTNATVGEED